jgi:hypothetical protein
MSSDTNTFSFENSISLLYEDKKRLKTKLADNVYMVINVGINQGYSVLRFMNDNGDDIDVPTCFSLYNIDFEDYFKIVPIVKGYQFYIVMFKSSYEFTYAGQTSSLHKVERWFTKGEHKWTAF